MGVRERYEAKMKKQSVKTQNNIGKTTTGVMGRYEKKMRKKELETTISLDTLETDLNSLGTTIKGIYDGWQTEETMRNTRSSIESMYNRLLSYQDYQKQYGGVDLSEQTEAYKSILDDWENRTTLYGGFKNADAYKKSAKNTELSDKFRVKTGTNKETGEDEYRGFTYDEVQAELKKYKKGSDEYEFLSNYTGYTNLNDFEKALKNAKPLEEPEWYTIYKNWEIPQATTLNEEETKKRGVITYYTVADQKAAEKERDTYLKEFIGNQTIEEFESNFKKAQENSYYEELKRQKKQYKLENGVNDLYADYRDNADFDEKSQYWDGHGWSTDDEKQAISVAKGMKGSIVTRDKETDTNTVYTDALYDYINNINNAQKLITNNILYGDTKTGANFEKKGYNKLKPEEVQLFNYLDYLDGENGTNLAQEYLDGMEQTLTKRAYYEKTGKVKETVDSNGWAAAGLSALSIPASVFGTLGTWAEKVESKIEGREYNPYSKSNTLSNFASDTREYTGENIAKATEGFELLGQNIPSFLYQTGMSMGDTLFGSAFFGTGYSVLAGTNSFQQKYRELYDAGEGQDIAFSGALASGLAEVVFEYISLDKLLKIKNVDGIKKGIKSALSQGGIEASEEFFTELANIISDDAILGESSELNKFIKDLKARGYTEKEINIEVAKKIGGQLGWAAAGGFASGTGMGAGASVMAYGKMSSIGKGIQARERTSEMLELASLTPKESEAYQVYNEYAQKGITADNIKKAQLGNLYYLSKTESAQTLDSKKSSDKEKASAFKTLHSLSVVDTKNTDAIRKKELNVGESTTVTSTGNSATIEGIKLSGDETKLVTNEGEISVEDMTLSDKDADLVVKAEGVAREYGEEMGTLFLEQYDGKADVNDYATSFNLAMNYAKHNFTQDMMLENKGVLSTSQVQAIHDATVHQHYVEQYNKLKAITEKQAKSKFIQGTFDDSIIDRDSKTTDGSKVNWSDLTPQQRDAIKFAQLFSEATGVNIKFIKSNVELGKHKGKNGSYDPKTNTIEIDVYAGRIDAKSVEDSIIPTLSHEMTHWMKYKASAIYDSIREDVMKTLAKGNKYKLTETELVQLEMGRIKRNHPEQDATPEDAIDELVARACEDMLSNSNYARKLLAKMSQSEQTKFIDKVKETFDNLIQWVNDLLSLYNSGSEEAQILRNYKHMLKKISKQWDSMLETAIETNQALQNEGIVAEQLVNGISEDGTTIVGKNNIQMSERTYAEGGRDFLEKWLSEQEGLTDADKKDILLQTDAIANLMKDIRENNELPDYARWASMDVVKDENGEKVLSVIVKNGDYAMNIDFSQVCKKRVALNAVLNAMVQSGDLNFYTLSETDVADLNAIIKKHEFEIACALCFVDSKRYRVGGWAESFCEGADKKKKGQMVHQYGFNEMVRSLVPKGSKIQIDEFNFTNRNIVGQPTSNLLSEMDDSELDFTLIDEILEREFKAGSKPTDLYAYAKAIKDNKELRKILNPAEIISSIGLDAIRLESPDLYKLINRHQGTAKPKFAHDVVAYTNDILKAKNFTKEKAKMVGGVRCQSFSDFMANMVFDYVQFISELSAKELTSHSYTKEPLFVRLFGMTGMKINMSLVPKAVQMTPEQQKYFAILNDPNANKRSAEYQKAKRDYKKLTVNAGLDENGNYIWEDETFPYDIAMELVVDPRYSANCGTIAVGISDAHILKLLNDDKISMVIPYHKSGLNHIVAMMRNIDLYNDYTNTQNTRFANGKKLEKVPDFDFYGDLYGKDGKEGTHNPKQTADNYLKWCDEHNYIPKFEKSRIGRRFRDNPNYYKLLVDFRVYDTDGTYREQQPVKPIYPENEEFKDLILNGVVGKDGKVYGGLKQQQGTSDRLDAESKQIVDEFRNKLKEKYGKDVLATKNSDRDSAGNTLTQEQQDYFKDSKVRDKDGNLLVVRHGTSNDFHIFDFSKSGKNGKAEGYGFYFSDDKEITKMYGEIQKELYLNITKPMYNNKRTVKKSELTKLVNALIDFDYDKWETNWKDSFISNYVNTYEFQMSRQYAVQQFVNQIWEYNDNDQDLIFEVAQADGRMYENSTMREFYNVLTESIGYDGIIAEWSHADGKSNVYVTFNPEQSKYTSNTTPTSNTDMRYSDRVTDKETLDFLENQEHITTYKSMVLIDGKLYSPMATQTKGEDGKYRLPKDHSMLGVWQQAVEDISNVKKNNDGSIKLTLNKKTGQEYASYELKKENGGGTPVIAAYNPYEHSSNLVLNDQFESAYNRPNLVTVECVIPVSELTSGYQAEYSKDSVGYLDWHSGAVAGQLTNNQRKVYLSRWLKPVRIVPDSEVAQMYKDALEKDGISVPFNVVTPSLLEELENIGVPIDNTGTGQYKSWHKNNPEKFPFRNSNKDGIAYSDRDNVSVYDKLGETDRLIKDNEKLKADVERLKERLKIERQVTNGNYFNENQLNAVAGHIRNIANSNYDKKELVHFLNSIYQYIAHSPDLNWQDLYSQCYELADLVLDKSRVETVTNPYYKDILDDIRKTKISVNEQQIQNAKYRLGNKWRNSFFNKISITDNGISLDSQWKEWAATYPNIFDADLSAADQLVELLDIYDSVRQASETVVEYDKEERTRWLAREIYNQYWNVSPIRTVADKYDKQIKKLNFEHRKAMQEFRDRYEEKLKKQHQTDKAKAQELITKIRERKDKEIAEVKQQSKERMDAYKENAERKTRIQSITSNALTLNKWLVKNSKDEHIHESLKAPVVSLLNAINFSSKRMLDKNIPTQKDISLSKALSQVKDMMVDASNGKEELVELYGHDMDEDIAKMVDSVYDIMRTVGDNEFVLNKMSLQSLQTLDKMVKTIKQSVSKMNKFHMVNHAKGIANLSQESMEYLDELGKAKVFDGLRGKAKKLLNWDNSLPCHAFKRFGEGGIKVFEAFQDGWDKFAFHIKKIIDYANDTYTSEEVKEWGESIKTFKILIPATEIEQADPNYKPKYQTVQMTIPQIMSLYCTQKREQGKNHILEGGIRVADFKTKKGEVVSQSDGAILTYSDVATIVSTLDARQKLVADKLQMFMNTTCTEWGNEVSMLRFGYKAFGEDNYFPIQSDQNNLAVNDETEKNNSLFRLLNMSFTKGLVKGANNRIVISDIFDVFAQHTSDMAKYNALALPVLDAFKWYNYKEKITKGNNTFITKGVKQSIESAFGKDGQNYLTTFLKDLNGEQEVTRDTLGKHFFTSAKIAAVGMNLRVMALQPTSYLRAGAVIDYKYLTKALIHKPKISKAEQHCGIALWKSMGYYDTNVQRGVEEQIKHQNGIKDKAIEWSMKGAEIADKITWGYLWNACELEIREKRKDLKVGSAEFYTEIGKRLREVIYGSQVVDSTMTRSQMMRSNNTWDKMLTAFASEPTLAYSMLQDAYMGLQLDARRLGKKEAFKKNGKKIARVLVAYTLTNAMAALVESGFDAFRDDDEEEMDIEEFMKMYMTNFATDMSVISKIPYFKEMVSIFSGYGSTRSDTQWMESFANAIKGWMKVSAGEGNPITAIKHSFRSISYLTGLPFYNAYRDFMAALNKLDILTAEELEEMLKEFFS